MAKSSQAKANPTPKESTDARKSKKARTCKDGGSGAADDDAQPPTSAFCAGDVKTVVNMVALDDITAYLATMVDSNVGILPEDAQALLDDAAKDLDCWDDQRLQRLLGKQLAKDGRGKNYEEKRKELFNAIPIPARRPALSPKASNRVSPLDGKQETRASLHADADAAIAAHKDQIVIEEGGAAVSS